ncbi:MAG: hypothetical protein L0154_27025 [Chloroflexi bacterium]|nr:hypothetical protein [Chloroflexota bacterium]
MNTQKQLERLILKQATLPDDLWDTYDKVIIDTGERVRILQQRQRELWQQSAQVNLNSPQNAFNEISRITLDAFWEMPSTKINQLLHRLIGNRRFVVDEGETVGIGNAPKRTKRKYR